MKRASAHGPEAQYHLQRLAEAGRLDEAVDGLEKLRIDKPLPAPIYLSLLKSCIKQKSLLHVKRLHAHLAHHNLHICPFIGENLLLANARCGDIDAARDLFGRLPCRTVFSWTAIISGFTESGLARDAIRLHQSMLQDGLEPDRYTFASLFKACGAIADVESGRNLHAVARSKGFSSDLFVMTAVLSMYAKCGVLSDAEDIFRGLPNRDLVSWNAILTAYVDNCQAEKALLVYRQMLEEGLEPSHQTIVISLQACGVLAEKEIHTTQILEIGEALHSDARRRNLTSHVFVHTTLASMYGKCGELVKSQNVFIGQPQHHLSLWNAMLSAYVDQGFGDEALRLFKHMQQEGRVPDQRTFVVAIQACLNFAAGEEQSTSKQISLDIGQALHADAEKHGLSSDVYVATTLISLYGKTGAIAKAEEVFSSLSNNASIPWNAMLCAYIDRGQQEKVLMLYEQMERQRMVVDVTSLISVLQACSELGYIGTCWNLHFSVVSKEHESDIFLRSALIHAYGGSGSMKDAQSVYDGLLQLDSVSLNACIAGYAGEGNYGASVDMLAEGQYAGCKTDAITYASVMSACNHAGRILGGIEYFIAMVRDHGISPDSRHHASIADLLGRAGDFKRIECFINRISQPVDLSTWLFVLGSCRVHGNVELAKEVFENAVSMEPMQTTAYVSMSNIYAGA